MRILKAGALLRCPRCGTGKLFGGSFRMHRECSFCRLTFEREQGFFVGAIYVNYAFTVLIAVAGFFLLDYYAEISLGRQLVLWGAFTILFPIFFFRHSRSLWLSMAYLLDPDNEPRLRLVRK
ncbi:MAG TPA: DUF983 domain-containing protein [Candidatus Binatia bacterium]